MADENGRVDEPASEKYRIESLPGFDLVPRDMRDALGKFNDEAEEIVHSFLGTLEPQQPPPIIYRLFCKLTCQ